MTDPQRIQPDTVAYLFTVLMLLAALGRYGRQAIEWLLMSFYDFFIRRNPVKW